ncbi:MAG TPA: hemerythrin domain-containing protein [Acidimicrobiales bacterium]|nr:hemerythrin domain-containing protein [Acidimicrobiales bacterium]
MAPLSDTSDMFAVHRVFRESLGSAATLVGSAEGGGERVELIANYYDNVLRFLEAHHNGEEVLIWPKLEQRCPEHLATVERAAAQHESVIDFNAAAMSSGRAWQGSTSTEDRDGFVDALEALHNALVEHLDEEESVVLPLCAEHITQEEWGQLPGHGLAAFTGDKVWLILGLIREGMSQEQRDAMLAHMPPPAADMWTSMGESSFNSLIAEVRRSPS